MLVLGRKPGEYIVIDNKITVKVIKTNAGEIRLAVKAPKYMKIIRGEIYNQPGENF